MSYDKFARRVPHMLVLKSRYWLDDACIRAAETLGWRVATAPVVMEGILPREAIRHLLNTLAEFRPDFILSINLAGMDETGLLAGLFEDLDVPHATWFVDVPRTIIMGRTCYGGRNAVGLTWDAAYEPYLKRAAFAHTATVPLAVDATLFNAAPLDTWECPPTFVGASMTEPSETEWKAVRRIPALAGAVDEAFAAGRVTRERFGAGPEAMLGPEAALTLDAEGFRHAELIFFTEGTRRLRRQLAQTLMPEGLHVRGDAHWREIVPDAGPPLDYENELPEYYRRCPLNVNITSVQMPTAVNQRVFDCPAAGGFLLTDAQASLHELFDESELATYTGFAQCAELFRHFMRNPKARTEIVRKARARIMNEHTYGHRLQRIVALLKAYFGA